MKKFLIRLFNLQQTECPSCKVYKEWINQIVATSDSNNSILTGEINDLRNKLDAAYHKINEDKEAEREERQGIENVILEFARLKPRPEIKVNVPPPSDQASRLKQGASWPAIKAQLEADARKKAAIFKEREQQEVAAGRMAPSENLREPKEGAK